MAMAYIDVLDNLDINVIVVRKVAFCAALPALRVLIAATRSRVVRPASPPTEASSSSSSSSSALGARIVAPSFNVVTSSTR